MNGTIVQALANLANQDDNVQEWDHYLEAALLAIRTMPNVSTGHSATKLLYSYDLRTPDIGQVHHDHLARPYCEEASEKLDTTSLIDQSKRAYREAVFGGTDYGLITMATTSD
jgi:hypothetical protein